MDLNMMPSYLKYLLQNVAVYRNLSWVGIVGRLVNCMVYVLLFFIRIFPLVSYLFSVIMAWESRQSMVSVHQEIVRMAVLSVYSIKCC
jgi:hypothetical protein